MASWLVGKVAARAREAAGAPAAQRPVEELAAELEQQARAVADRPQASLHAASELLSRWLEQSCDSSSGSSGPPGCFLLLATTGPSTPTSSSASSAGGERVPLGFREALLRGRAFELLLDACSRATPLRTTLQRCGSASSAPLLQALQQVAEQVLLPGSLRLWPGLLQALLDAKSDQDGAAAPLRKGPGSLRWEQWARRVFKILKRGWESEALPRLLNHLDHRLSDLAGRTDKAEQAGVGSGADELLRGRGASGARLSKQGIRAALARERLRARAGAAEALRLRSELLCGACSWLTAAASGGAGKAPKLERLLADANDAMAALDGGVKEKHAEQESLSGSLGELGGELQRQITGIQMTRQAFAEKRSSLQEQRKDLLRRLEELDVHLEHLGREEESCASQERQLRDQLHGTSAHYEKMIATVVRDQKALADEKLRAVSYKECAHLALDVARENVERRGAEFSEQLRRRRGELGRTLAQYLRVERLRIEAASECLEACDAAPWKPQGAGGGAAGGGAGQDQPEAEVVVSEAWRASQRLLRHAEAALGTAEAEASPPAGQAAEAPEVPGPGPEEEEAEQAGEGGGAAASEEDPSRRLEEAREVFARAGEQLCVDCSASGAEWASISHGTYLCTECAGRHRGLGVHLSFVRSTTMDRWNPGQLRRMQLGGNDNFREFLAGFPQLSAATTTTEALSALYSSRAAAFYRRRLSHLCDGRGTAQQEPAPSADEGHLPMGPEEATAGGGSAGALPAGDEDSSLPRADDEASGSLAEERAALAAARADFLQRLERHRGGGSPAKGGDAG